MFETMLREKSCWNKLDGIDPQITFPCTPLAIDNKTIVVPLSRPINQWTPYKAMKIPQYNTITKQWTASIEYGKNMNATGFTAAYNPQNKELYIYTQAKQLFKYSFTSSEWTVIDVKMNAGHSAASLFIDNNFHVLGGYYDRKHHMLKSGEDEFIEMHIFDEFARYITGGKSVHIASKNQLLFMGGFGKCILWSDNIYSCDLTTMKWKMSNLKLPVEMSDFGVTLSNDERYLIIFGGKTRKGATDLIYALEMNGDDNMKWRESKVKCPERGEVHTVKMEDQSFSDLIIYGYIRQYLEIEYPPSDIMGILNDWYCQECVHFFCVAAEDYSKYYATHYVADLNDILQF